MPTLKIMIIDQGDLGKFEGNHVALIPVRSFSKGKTRLAPVLATRDRSDLLKKCALRVITACAPIPTFIISSDDEVGRFARRLGVPRISDHGETLSSTVQWAFSLARDNGARHVTIAHGDLPHAENIPGLYKDNVITIVPDRRRDGTNVLSLPAGARFEFAYGPNSFQQHLDGAKKTGLATEVVENPALTFDVDTPDDWSEFISGAQCNTVPDMPSASPDNDWSNRR